MDAIEVFKPPAIQLCENCGGDGGWYCGACDEWECCTICGGTGEYEVERTAIELADLDQINRDKPAPEEGPC